MVATVSVDAHFAKSDPEVVAIYQRLLAAARACGPFTEDPKKTSIHLVRHYAFAGVAARQSSIILTLKSDKDIGSPRIVKRQQASANRWYVDVRLTKAADVDRQLKAWIAVAYRISGPSTRTARSRPRRVA
jgi:hypothetical protein